MANLGMNFDANAVEPSAPIELLQPGDYPAQIVQSEMKDTSKGDGGERLSLEFDIIDGPAKGRKLWAGLNLKNANPKTVEIAQRELSAICHAVGKLNVNDSEELHFKPMLVTVKVVPATTERAAKNEIKGYKALSNKPPVQRTAASPQAQPATTTGARPWTRKTA